MTPIEAAKKSFAMCKKSNAKNRACAGYIAKQLLISAKVPQIDIDAATDRIEQLLDEWFQLRQTQPNFFPSDSVDTHISDHEIDLTNSPVVES